MLATGRLFCCVLLAVALHGASAGQVRADAASATAPNASSEPEPTSAGPVNVPAASDTASLTAAPALSAAVIDPLPAAAGPRAPAPDDATVYVNVGYFHSDLVMRRSDLADAPAMVKAAVDRTKAGEWIIIGWGPWWFGRDVKGAPFRPLPLRMMVGVWTLVVPQTHSQLRVAAIDRPGPAPGEGNMAVRPLQISRSNLKPLLQRIDRSFVVGRDGGPVGENRKGLADGVSVYRSVEIYHLTHQCNHWLGEVLRAGGFSTFYLLDLFPQTLALDLTIGGAKGPATRGAAAEPGLAKEGAPVVADAAPSATASAAAPTPAVAPAPAP